MTNLYRFDTTARAERYFTATLLPHILLSNNFSALRKLFQMIFSNKVCENLPEDFEIVSELDPLRDGSVENQNVKKLYQTFKRIAVPDLFLRWSHLCLVIEAKFFTDPAAEELYTQVKLQQEAIAKVKPYTVYRDWNVKFAVLTVEGTEISTDSNIINLNWEHLLQTLKSDVPVSPDLEYAFHAIRSALQRAKRPESTVITYEKLKFAKLFEQLSRLVAEGKIYIGYTGGIEALESATLTELEQRYHYKVSEYRWSDNWISLDQFLGRVFRLRGLVKSYDDRSE